MRRFPKTAIRSPPPTDEIITITRRTNSYGKKMICTNQILVLMFLFVIGCIIYMYNAHIQNLENQLGGGGGKTQNMFGIDPSTFLIPMPTGIPTKRYDPDVLTDPYIPPLKEDGYVGGGGYSRGLPQLSAPIQTFPIMGPSVVPVNIETRGIPNQYTQMGILTQSGENFSKNDNLAKLILPLMGRRHLSGRDKWQYYTMSNTGNINTKLPIRANGRSCTSEYGCDPLYSGDIVYVEGYDHTFKATIYENSIFSYIPVL